MPAELTGGVTFSMAWPGRIAEYLAGVRRSGWFVAAPLLAFSVAFHAALIGWQFALMHAAVGAAYTYACLQMVFLRNQHVPYVSPYVPGDDARLRFLTYGAALLISALVVAAIERRSLTNPVAWVALIGGLLMAGPATTLATYLLPTRPATIDLDETAPLPTQRLNLA
jgi:hypothetical protein